MIQYRIVSNSTVTRKQLSPRDPDFKVKVFERALNGCHWKEGDTVKIKGTRNKGEIVEIKRELNGINWYNNQPQFIVVNVNDEYKLAHPNQLKRARIRKK